MWRKRTKTDDNEEQPVEQAGCGFSKNGEQGCHAYLTIEGKLFYSRYRSEQNGKPLSTRYGSVLLYLLPKQAQIVQVQVKHLAWEGAAYQFLHFDTLEYTFADAQKQLCSVSFRYDSEHIAKDKILSVQIAGVMIDSAGQQQAFAETIPLKITGESL